MGEVVWGGPQPQPLCNDIMLTPQVTQNPIIWAKLDEYNFVRLLLYADHGQHVNVLKQFVYVSYGQGKQFEVALSLNLDVMTSFWPPQVTQNPKLWATYGGYNCVSLILYANEQHINVLKQFVYV